jgi:hypothetical protein
MERANSLESVRTILDALYEHDRETHRQIDSLRSAIRYMGQDGAPQPQHPHVLRSTPTQLPKEAEEAAAPGREYPGPESKRLEQILEVARKQGGHFTVQDLKRLLKGQVPDSFLDTSVYTTLRRAIEHGVISRKANGYSMVSR